MGVCAAGNIAAPKVLSADFWVEAGVFHYCLLTACFGMLVGQVMLLATWAAMGPQAVVLRVPVAVVSLLLMLVAYVAGLQTRGASELNATESFITAGVAALVLFPGAQAPLWLMRGMLKGGIVEQNTAAKPAQFGVLHLMALTAFVAVALLITRLVITGPVTDRMRDWPLSNVLVTAFIVLVYASSVAVACILLVLSDREHRRFAGLLILALTLVLVATIAAVIAVGVAAFIASDALLNSEPTTTSRIVTGLTGGAVSFGVGVFMMQSAGLYCLRLLGYRLAERRPGAAAPNPPAGTSAAASTDATSSYHLTRREPPA